MDVSSDVRINLPPWLRLLTDIMKILELMPRDGAAMALQESKQRCSWRHMCSCRHKDRRQRLLQDGWMGMPCHLRYAARVTSTTGFLDEMTRLQSSERCAFPPSQPIFAKQPTCASFAESYGPDYMFRLSSPRRPSSRPLAPLLKLRHRASTASGVLRATSASGICCISQIQPVAS